MDGLGGVKTLRAAAEQNGVAGFDRDGGGIGPDIRPAFIDHAQHAERLDDAADDHAVRPVHCASVRASGSGRAATSSSPLAMAFTRAGLSTSRSPKAGEPEKFCMSRALASRIFASLARSKSAAARNAKSRVAASARAKILAAARAFAPACAIWSVWWSGSAVMRISLPSPGGKINCALFGMGHARYPRFACSGVHAARRAGTAHVPA